MSREPSESGAEAVVWRRSHNPDDATFATARDPVWKCAVHGVREYGWRLAEDDRLCGMPRFGRSFCGLPLRLSVRLPTVSRKIENGHIELEIIGDPRDPRLVGHRFSPGFALAPPPSKGFQAER